ncbi:MAG: hypothetical protein ACFFC7_27770 [Candidatus Hermodarchaeota archaeon]
MKSKIISVRVPNDLAEKMKKYDSINWSGHIRTFIGEQIEEFENGEQKLLVA